MYFHCGITCRLASNAGSKTDLMPNDANNKVLCKLGL